MIESPSSFERLLDRLGAERFALAMDHLLGAAIRIAALPAFKRPFSWFSCRWRRCFSERGSGLC
jgi:hypothetical protein